MTTFLIATRNAHKVQEIQAVLGPGFDCRTLAEFADPPAIAETGATFADNAILKSRGLAAWLAAGSGNSSIPVSAVLADDSGLEVDALDGAPGVQSARFAATEFGLEGNAPDGANNQKLLRLLATVPIERRTARFRCALALTRIDTPDASRVFEGSCEGRIGFLQRGGHGFGYDPLFVPDGFDRTFAELGEETKNRISHRSRALEKLRAWLGEVRTAERPG